MSTATTLIETEKRSAERSRSKLVPELRFNEFEGQFKLKEFDEITDITRLAGYEYSKYWKEDEEQEIIALRGYNIGKGELNLRDLGYISNKLSLQLKRSRLSVGDIVYPCVGSIGNAVVIDENDKYHIQQNIAKITCNTSASPNYLVQFLTSNYGMREVYRFNASGAQPNVLVGSLRKYRINIPTLPEQQKIAFFLSAVDNKIQQLTKKKALLEQYKKGVMQQLFSGQLRFKDENGNPYPDWEEKRLGEITKYTKGFAFKSVDYQDSGVRIVRVSDLLATSIKKDNEKVFLSSEKASDYSKYQLIQGNIIITTVGSKPEMIESAVGRGIYINNNNEGLLNQNMLKFENIEGVFNRFVIGLINSKRYQHYMKGIARGNANQANITIVDLLQYKVPLPSLPEQQKIANYLSAIDTKIERVNNQITQTQTFKKGLLQQMFV